MTTTKTKSDSTAQRSTGRAEKVTPQDLESEQSTLGAMMMDPRAASRALEQLAGDDFYRDLHRRIFDAISALSAKGDAIDLVTVAGQLRQRGHLEEVGGASYLAALHEACPSSANIDSYMSVVRDLAQKRRYLVLSEGLDNHARNGQTGEEVRLWLVEQAREIEKRASSVQSDTEGYTAPDLMSGEFPAADCIINGLLPVGLTMLGGKPKIGKAQPLDSKILTPGGWRFMGDLKVGDQVMGSNGRPTTILQVHPQGVMPCYRVLFSDGASVETTADHLWLVESHNHRTQKRPGQVRTTEQISHMIEQGKNRHTHIPITQPVDFAPSDTLPIDPYLLGLLIGDGGMTRVVSFTSNDQELFTALSNLLPPGNKCLPTFDNSAVTITGTDGRRGASTVNPVRQTLLALGLHGCKSPKKFIPLEFKRSTVADRFALLQGLLDTDGGVENAVAVFSTSSIHLARDVREIVETLGGTASVSSKPCGYRKDGVYHECLTGYRVRVCLPASLGCPFRLSRKASQWTSSRTKTDRKPVRRIVGVEFMREAEAQCITVDAADSLYLTEHCIVTHNSWLALAFTIAAASGGAALGTIKVNAVESLYLALEDTPRRLQSRMQKLLVGGAAPPGMSLYTRWPRLAEGGVLRLQEYLEAHPKCRLVIIDTLQRFRSARTKDGDIYQEDYDAMGVLKTFAEQHNIAIAVIHHLRKAETEDPLEAISGSTGLTGAVDAVLVLRRRRNSPDATIYVTGRDLDEREIAVRWDKEIGTWTELGDAEEHRVSEERQEILQVLREGVEDMSPKDIGGALGKREEAVRAILWKMMRDHQVQKVQSGRYRLGREAPPSPNITPENTAVMPLRPLCVMDSDQEDPFGDLDEPDPPKHNDITHNAHNGITALPPKTRQMLKDLPPDFPRDDLERFCVAWGNEFDLPLAVSDIQVYLPKWRDAGYRFE